MKRRLLMAAGMSALLLATVAPGVSMARGQERFGQVPTRARTIDRDLLPSRERRNRMVMVAVELEGRSVSAYQGAALASGRRLSEGRTEQLRSLVRTRQARTRARIVSLGGDIQFTYTDVLNGFRIRAKASSIRNIVALPGVKRVLTVPRHTRGTENTTHYLGADKTWAQTGFTGKGVTIAIIDDGINYYHADFAGAGFDAWKADNGLTRGNDFPTAKVVDGYDLVGDAYDAEDENPIIAPDPDPLSCVDPGPEDFAHGTHVAGIAAGEGVTNAGKTYPGPYTPGALDAADLRIFPGVAPQAKLMAFRVFGCSGSTYVTTDAIELAVRAGADIINMSLGAPLGSPNSLDALASDNASLAGVTVVAAAGNEGPSAYITGSPGASLRAISVAAMDAVPHFPAATIDMPTGADIAAINANDATLPVTGKVNHFRDDPSTQGDPDTGEGFEDSGCTDSAYTYNGFHAGQIAAVQRGACARIDKAKAGQQHDATAVIQINTAPGLPPYENTILGVTIPFIGVSSTVDGRLQAADGKTITISSAGTTPNDQFKHITDFSSAGPARVRQLVKPDISAPGQSVFSADGFTAAKGISAGGTSMATPAIAGVAALVKQAHPGWQPRAIKAAIIGTAAATKVKPQEIRQAGAGLAQPRRAVDTRAFVYTEPGSSSITFGYQEASNQPGTTTAFTQSRSLTLINTGTTAITYDLSNAFDTQSHGLVVRVKPSTVRVPAKSERSVAVVISLSDGAAGGLPSNAPGHQTTVATDSFGQGYTPITLVAGTITARPRGGGAGIYPLGVPWLVVPRAESTIQDQPGSRKPWASEGDQRTSSIRVKNYGLHKGIADLFAWGLQDPQEAIGGLDLRAGGVQSVDARVCDTQAKPADRCVIFALNLWGRYDNAAENDYVVLIDTDDDDSPDIEIDVIDMGAILGTLNGVAGAFIFDYASFDLLNVYYANVGTNGSTILIPALASDLGLKPKGDHTFEWWAEAYPYADDDGQAFQFDVMNTGLVTEGSNALAQFDVFDPVLNTGEYREMKPGVTRTIPLSVDASRFNPKARGQKGWMIVSLDDQNGQFQADLVPVGANLP